MVFLIYKSKYGEQFTAKLFETLAQQEADPAMIRLLLKSRNVPLLLHPAFSEKLVDNC